MRRLIKKSRLNSIKIKIIYYKNTRALKLSIIT